MYNADRVVHPRWSPITESLRSPRSYGNIGDSLIALQLVKCAIRDMMSSLKDQGHHEALRRRCFQTYLRDNT